MNEEQPPDVDDDHAPDREGSRWVRPVVVGLLLTGLVHIGSAVYSWQTEPTDAEQEAAIESILPEGIEIVRFRDGGFVDQRNADLLFTGPYADLLTAPRDEVMEHAVSLGWTRDGVNHVRKGRIEVTIITTTPPEGRASARPLDRVPSALERGLYWLPFAGGVWVAVNRRRRPSE